jgi:hypothetical protein
MDGRLIFLHSVWRLIRPGRCVEVWPTMRREGAREGEADVLLKHMEAQPRKAGRGQNADPYQN